MIRTQKLESELLSLVLSYILTLTPPLLLLPPSNELLVQKDNNNKQDVNSDQDNPTLEICQPEGTTQTNSSNNCKEQYQEEANASKKNENKNLHIILYEISFELSPARHYHQYQLNQIKWHHHILCIQKKIFYVEFVKLVCVKIAKIYSMLNKVIVGYKLFSY